MCLGKGGKGLCGSAACAGSREAAYWTEDGVWGEAGGAEAAVLPQDRKQVPGAGRGDRQARP